MIIEKINLKTTTNPEGVTEKNNQLNEKPEIESPFEI